MLIIFYKIPQRKSCLCWANFESGQIKANSQVRSSKKAWKVKDVKVLVAQSCQLFATPWTVAYHAPLSMEFSRQEYWSEFPFPSSGAVLTQGSNLHLLHWQADSLPLSHQGSPIGRLVCNKYRQWANNPTV